MNKLDRIDPNHLAGNPRATLSAWLAYEQLVLAAYKMFPKAYVWRPTNKTPSTVSTRLRDAIRGKIAFDYPSEISTPQLANWYSQIVIKYTKEHVYIGPPEGVQSVLEGSSVTKNSAGFVYPELSFEEVAAFQLLISNGRLADPVTVIRPPDLTLLPPRVNVEVLNRPDGSIVMI